MSPLETKRSTRWLPMNPAAPVTRATPPDARAGSVGSGLKSSIGGDQVREDPVLRDEGRGFEAGMHGELAEDVLDVSPRSPGTDHEDSGDPFVVRSFRKQGEDLALSASEMGDASVGSIPLPLAVE